MTGTLTIRLNPQLRERLDKTRLEMPYTPTVTTVVERGIVLAIEEMERMTKAAREGQP